MVDYESMYRKAATSYFQAGASVPLREMNITHLESAQSQSSNIPHANAQELCGWANVEMLFPEFKGSNIISRDVIEERAITAFGEAYDLYQEECEGLLPLRRLELVHATLPFYVSYANNIPITFEQVADVRDRVVTVGKSVVKMAEADDQFLQDGRAEALCAETISMLGLLSKKGDTRRPVDVVAVPSTLRQRLANSSRNKTDKNIREKWDLTRLKFSGKGWQPQSKIAFDTKHLRSEKAQPAEDITVVSSELYLTNGIYDTIFTLRALTRYLGGAASKEEKVFAKDMIARITRLTS